MKKALLIVDVQNDYFTNGKCELFQSEFALEVILNLKDAFKEKGFPVYYVQHINDEEAPFFVRNTNGVKIHQKVTPQTDTNIIIKQYPNSFYQTDLHEKLQADFVEEITVCGMMTHMCIDTTVRAGVELGYKIKLVSDGCTTKDLIWNNTVLPATAVHNVFMASLDGKFADVLTGIQMLSSLSK